MIVGRRSVDSGWRALVMAAAVMVVIAAGAVRHAAATSINVRVSADGREITIEDDGRGFDLAACRAKPGHFGLRGMQERGRRVGATVDIDSAPTTGTRVTIRLADGPAHAASENPKTLA